MRVVIAWALLVFGAGVVGAAVGGAGGVPAERGAMSACEVLAELRAAYRARVPFVERVEVTAGRGEVGRASVTRVYADGEGLAALEIGSYLVNAVPGDEDEVGGRVLMAHELDVGSYVEVVDLGEIGAGVDGLGGRAWYENEAWWSIGSYLPPMSAMSLELVFGREECVPSPIGVVRGVSWESVEDEGRGLELRGTFARGLVTVSVDDRRWRVRSVRVDYADGERSIVCEHRLEATGADQVDRRRWVIGTSDRREVGSIRELRAKPGDVGVGSLVPMFEIRDIGSVLGLTARPEPEVPRGGVVVLCGLGSGGEAGVVLSACVEAGIDALGVVAAAPGGGHGDGAGGAGFASAVRGAYDASGGRLAGLSIAPSRSLRRFTAHGGCVAVAVGERGVVRGVYEIEAELSADRVARLVSRIRGVLEDADVGPNDEDGLDSGSVGPGDGGAEG